MENEKAEIEREKVRIEKEKAELEKECEELKKELAQIKGSAPFLAASDKTAEAGGVPTSKTFYRRKRQEGKRKKTGGQLGHKGHGRKRPNPTEPPIYITLKECPHCGTAVNEPITSAEQERTVTEIPPPEHAVYKVIKLGYWCTKCKKIVRGNAYWLPPHWQFGPSVACWVAYHRMLGLPIGKIQSSLFETYDLKMSEAEILQLEKWVADIFKDDYEKLREAIVESNAVNADETRFRINGANGWMWVFASALALFYKIAPTRGHEVPVAVLDGFNGVLGRDAWKPYDFVECSGQQLDLIHVNRWLERAEYKHGIDPRTILSAQPANFTKIGKRPDKFIEFVDGVRSIMKRAIEYSESDPPPSLASRKNMAKQLKEELLVLLDRDEWDEKDIIRISKELRKRVYMLFTFIEREDVPWHNNDAERGIRQGVLHRKISGGRRTWTGAEVLEILLSIYETAKKNGMSFYKLIMGKMVPIFEKENLNYAWTF
jgi:transposase